MPPPNTPLSPTPPPPARNFKRGYHENAFSATTGDRSECAKPTEMQLAVEGRERAALVLGSWEQLVWRSVGRGESIPQTRLRYQKEMIGLSSGEDEWADEGEKKWADEGEKNGGEKGKGKESGKEKEREKGLDEKGKRARKSEGGSGRKR
ncbi:hypothetical protein IMSHALPRED_002769 [Imshaugia aleurites]|uniref:Uncharacterized protein n=1 Tax=Imshaugia aleurites TaxID=172621 RepID=A0A8H3J692_9LECA|nr:hypothetical protein IMSHALPRED_002769 [Imshaugia aleurites]